MARTRAGLLDGALKAVARQGTRRTTMNDIAACAGVAKATLYNHFRTKTDVWRALVEAELADLIADCADLPLREALALAATRIGTHPGLRQVARTEPAVLAALLTSGTGSTSGTGEMPAQAWDQARHAVRQKLAAAGIAGADLAAGTDVVLRWLVSHVTEPAGPDAVEFAAGCLVRGLPTHDTG